MMQTAPPQQSPFRTVWQLTDWSYYRSKSLDIEADWSLMPTVNAFEAWWQIELLAIRYADQNAKAAKARARLAKDNAPKAKKQKELQKVA